MKNLDVERAVKEAGDLLKLAYQADPRCLDFEDPADRWTLACAIVANLLHWADRFAENNSSDEVYGSGELLRLAALYYHGDIDEGETEDEDEFLDEDDDHLRYLYESGVLEGKLDSDEEAPTGATN